MPIGLVQRCDVGRGKSWICSGAVVNTIIFSQPITGGETTHS